MTHGPLKAYSITMMPTQGVLPVPTYPALGKLLQFWVLWYLAF